MLNFAKVQQLVDNGYIFFIIIWFAASGMLMRQFWRGAFWPRVTARVIGHNLARGDPSDGSLELELTLPDGHTIVRASLQNNDSVYFPHKWPIGTSIVVAYNPASPETVTWATGKMMVLIMICIVPLPVVALVWNHAI